MIKKIIIIICLLILGLFLIPKVIARQDTSTKEVLAAPAKELKDYSVIALINHYSAYYGQDPALLRRVAECESEHDKHASGDGGRAYSVFQFHKGTFDTWSKQRGEVLDYKSYHDHIKLATWAFAQGEEYRRNWTAYRAIKNGGKYSFYSKLLKKSFVAYCEPV